MLLDLLSQLRRDSVRRRRYFVAAIVATQLVAGHFYAATGGSISGVVRDPSGAVIPETELVLVNTGAADCLSNTV